MRYRYTALRADRDPLRNLLQGDLNLNIAEAHAFNTTDKFSLDVFLVNGWTGQVRHATVYAAI